MSFTPSFLVHYDQLNNVYKCITTDNSDEEVCGYLNYDLDEDEYNVVTIRKVKYWFIENQTNYKYNTLKDFFIENKIEFYQFGC